MSDVRTSKTIAEVVRHADLLLESGDEVLCLTPDEWRQIKSGISTVEGERLRQKVSDLETDVESREEYINRSAHEKESTLAYGERQARRAESLANTVELQLAEIERLRSGHDPQCDILEINADGIFKPCNCIKRGAHEKDGGCTRSHPHENMSHDCERLTEIARLTNTLARREKDRERDVMKALEERDDFHAYADQLAECIAQMTDTVIGEHSSMNCPWENAIEACCAFIAEKHPAVETTAECAVHGFGSQVCTCKVCPDPMPRVTIVETKGGPA